MFKNSLLGLGLFIFLLAGCSSVAPEADLGAQADVRLQFTTVATFTTGPRQGQTLTGTTTVVTPDTGDFAGIFLRGSFSGSGRRGSVTGSFTDGFKGIKPVIRFRNGDVLIGFGTVGSDGKTYQGTFTLSGSKGTETGTLTLTLGSGSIPKPASASSGSISGKVVQPGDAPQVAFVYACFDKTPCDAMSQVAASAKVTLRQIPSTDGLDRRGADYVLTGLSNQAFNVYVSLDNGDGILTKDDLFGVIAYGAGGNITIGYSTPEDSLSGNLTPVTPDAKDIVLTLGG
jgi:hypothetical protein